VFSIIICTYNPTQEIFQRLLNAVSNFNVENIEHEVIIVDNNSNPSLSSTFFINSFLQNKINSKLIIESTPGLTNARIAGINEAKYSWLVFFDDDNEPASDYLKVATNAISLYPQVGAWGPGEIEVDFIGEVPNWVLGEKILFQQRNETKTVFNNEKLWQACYPFGTGLVINKTIAQIYKDRIADKMYTLSDRKGKSLASGGDVQLVLTCIEQNLSAGIIASLKVNHLIEHSKATLGYIQKQQYGTASAYIKAHNQVFFKNPIIVSPVSNFLILKVLYALFRIHYNKISKIKFRLLLALKMGELNASIESSGLRKPKLIKLYEKLIHV
jgi:glycosyltransferase involved in cell wall biosynthesis